jgi:hypothetical protein
MRSIQFLVLASFLFAQVTPALAYQAINWPGNASTIPQLPDLIFAPSISSDEESQETLPSLTDTPIDASIVLTRAQFTKLLIDSLYPASAFDRCLGKLVYKDNPDYRLLFADTSIEHPMAKEICMAMRTGLVRGYSDGTFRPDQPINFAEASKLLARVYAFTPFPVDPKLTWYVPYVQSLADRNVIPQTITSFDARITAADLREMLDRINGGVSWRPSLSVEELRKRTEKLWRMVR